jgi:ligand-binding SRPBCC domain-containing protein
MPGIQLLRNYHGRLERRQFVPYARPEVFAFFADAKNLETITPGFLRFHILSPDPIAMRPGATIDYELKLFGIRFCWRSLIESFEPEQRFVDVQLTGPYRSWRHVHEFENADCGTMIVDHVDYEMPWGLLGHLAHEISVKRSLERIFAFREQRIREIFPGRTGTPDGLHAQISRA